MSCHTIGERVKSVRKSKGLNQTEAAKILGISLTGWQKIERDESKPSADTLLDFNKFGIHPGWILTGTGPMMNDRSPEISDNTAGYISEEDTRLSHSFDQKQSDRERQIDGLDAELLQWVIVQIATWLRDEGVELEPDDLWLTFITSYHLTLMEQQKGQSLPDNIIDFAAVHDVLKLATK